MITKGDHRAPNRAMLRAVGFKDADFNKAIEINCRPERLDPPKRMLRRIVELGILVAVDTDAHATQQLSWHPYGCNRAAECGVPVKSIVNTWQLDDLLSWCASHEHAA